MHLKRWITGLLLLPVLVYILYRGGLLFALLIGAAGLVAMLEYDRIAYHAWQKTLPGPLPSSRPLPKWELPSAAEFWLRSWWKWSWCRP